MVPVSRWEPLAMTSRKLWADRTSMRRSARGGAVVLAATAALAGASLPAGAALLPAVARAAEAAQPAVAGVISTVAGNVGGPAAATSVGVAACGVAFHGSQVKIADGSTIRSVNSATDHL